MHTASSEWRLQITRLRRCTVRWATWLERSRRLQWMQQALDQLNVQGPPGGARPAKEDWDGHLAGDCGRGAGRTEAGAPGELAEIRRCKSSMAKVVTRPCHSPSRAVAPARGRAKRRQGRMWVGLLSDEMFIVRSAEAVSLVEGNTARTATVRSGRAPRRPRTHARMYDRGRDLGGLPVATAHSAAVAKVKAVAERRTNGGEESDQGIVVTKLANKARGAAWRSRWSEGLGATGERCRQSTGRTQSREIRWGQEPASGPPVSQEPARHGSSRGVPSQPERGAGCVSAHVRIWAGPVG